MLMTAIYLSPPSLLGKHLGDAASWYMLPLFRQNWRLFSPTPAIISARLAVRCNTVEQGWGSWRDPLETLYAKHYYYRISGHGKLLYIYRQIAVVLDQEIETVLAECKACELDRIALRLEQGGTYATAKRFAEKVCHGASPGQGSPFDATARISGIQFKLLTFYPLQYSERDLAGRRWGAVREVVFRPVQIRSATAN